MKQCFLYYLIILGSLSCPLRGELPKISIITSLYKGALFIEGFLENITQQTIFDQCELIIINANSPEDEEPLIRQYMTRFSNIVYLRLDEDPGIYAVWNMAIRMASGIYIINANVDDRFAKNCYEVRAKILDKHPKTELVYSDFYGTTIANDNFERIDTYAKKVINFEKLNPYLSYKIPLNSAWCLFHRAQFSFESIKHCCLPNNHPMWRKSMHEKYGYFNESFKSAGDWEMWLRAAQKGARFRYIEGVYGLFYINPTGLSIDPHGKGHKEYLKILAALNLFRHRICIPSSSGFKRPFIRKHRQPKDEGYVDA